MKIKLYSILLFSVIGLFACNKFTELSPISNRNEAVFFKTANDFIVALNGAYAGLQKIETYNGAYYVLFEMRSGNTNQGTDRTGTAQAYTDINLFIEGADNAHIYSAWKGSYKVIADCNLILDKLKTAEMEDNLKNTIQGEVLFLRSLMYYHLVVAFNNIPLILEPYQLGTTLTQSSAIEVYNQIGQDLTSAENTLPITSTAKGRATKGAAATLLAKVLLTQNKNKEATEVLKRIISNYGYDLTTNYTDLWPATGSKKNNAKESIFEIQFISGGIGQGSYLSNDFARTGALSTISFGRNTATNNLYNDYPTGDKRRDASINAYTANNTTTYYINKYYSNPSIQFDASVNFIVLRYADVLLMLAEALGETDESYGYIAQIRKRAGFPTITLNDIKQEPGTFKNKLLRERRLEFAFENHRWPDLLRFNAIEKVLSEEFSGAVVVPTLKKLYPIPLREMDINTSFKQNSE